MYNIEDHTPKYYSVVSLLIQDEDGALIPIYVLDIYDAKGSHCDRIRQSAPLTQGELNALQNAIDRDKAQFEVNTGLIELDAYF